MRQPTIHRSCSGLVVGSVFALATVSAPATATEPVAKLDGTSGFLSGQHEMALEAMTVEAWVRVESLAGGSSAGGGVVTSGTAFSQNFSLWLFPDNSTPEADWRPGFQINWNNGSAAFAGPAEGTAPMAFGTWAHVAASYDGDEVILYVDGLEVHRDTLGVPINWPALSTIALGNEFPGASEKIGGEMDEVRIWSTVRTAQQISDFMDVEICEGADLWARWSFDDGSTRDRTGQGRDLGLAGAASLGCADVVLDNVQADCITCAADFDHSGEVAFDDLLTLLTAWGDCGTDCPVECRPDMNQDGAVAFDDLLGLLTTWGPCP